MKKLIPLILFVFLFSCFNKTESNTNKLVVKKQFCEIEHEGLIFIPEYKLLQNDNLIKNYKPELLKNYFTIDSLNPGHYTIQYTTMFKLLESIDFTITNKVIDTITLCNDKINYKAVNHIPFIEKLKINEFYSIDVWTQGCVSYGSAIMKIERLKDGIYSTYKEKVKKLSQTEIELIRKFELELVNMNYGGCSNIDIYTLKYNKEELVINDGSCNWYGYSRIYRTIFKLDEK